MSEQMPDGLRYSERALWDAPTPTQAEVHAILGRLARTRSALRTSETISATDSRYAATQKAYEAGMEDACAEHLDAILALRKRHGDGGPNFTPDETAKAWNRALVAVAVKLGLATQEEAEARLRAARDADYERTQAVIDRLNAGRGGGR